MPQVWPEIWCSNSALSPPEEVSLKRSMCFTHPWWGEERGIRHSFPVGQRLVFIPWLFYVLRIHDVWLVKISFWWHVPFVVIFDICWVVYWCLGVLRVPYFCLTMVFRSHCCSTVISYFVFTLRHQSVCKVNCNLQFYRFQSLYFVTKDSHYLYLSHCYTKLFRGVICCVSWSLIAGSLC